MSTGVNLRHYLTLSTSISALVSTRIYQSSVPPGATLPFIWFRRREVEYLNCLNEAETKPWREMFDFEIVADDLEEADGIADKVRTRLHGARGTLSSTDSTVYQWVDVHDQSEDYVPRNMQADEVLQVVSLDVEVTNQ